MTRLVVHAALSMMATASTAIQVSAQSADSVPRELALALLRGPGGGVQLFVGATPERYPFELAPVSSRLLGAAQRDRQSTVVYVSTLEPETARRSWESQLTAAGWQRPRGYSPGPTAGFISSASPVVVPGFCNAGVFASLTANVRFSGGSTLIVSYTEPSMQSICSARSSPSPQFSVTRDTIPLPALNPPQDLSVVGFGGATGIDFWEQQARVSGTTTVATILEHYARQLQAANWVPSDVARTDATAAQSFRKRLTDGIELFASMVVQANPFDSTATMARVTVYRQR